MVLAELFAPAPAVSFTLRTVPTVGQRALEMPRATLSVGVELVLARRVSALTVTRRAPPRTWQVHAVCHGQEETLFFREDNDAARTRRHAFSESRRVCLSCPVIEQCLRHALSQPEEFGVWGGTHGTQRKAILARVAAGETDLEWEIALCLQ